MAGVICLLQSWDASFLAVWVVLSALSLVALLCFSGALFYLLYAKPTYDLWRYKINPNYPSTEKVKEEILVMMQGIVFSTMCPALSLYLSRIGWSQGYCGSVTEGLFGIQDYSWLGVSIFLVWFASDFYEFFYHWLGHYTATMWMHHKGHHAFYNPTPFAVIADSPLDQFLRAAPLLLFPMMMPVNMDMIFTMYSLLFYFNGLVQHSGYESEWIDGHTNLILTSYHHYLHHAKSTIHRPIFNGQFLQLWDILFQSNKYEGPCACSRCARDKGEREREQWDRVEKPDYSQLLTVAFWAQTGKATKKLE